MKMDCRLSDKEFETYRAILRDNPKSWQLFKIAKTLRDDGQERLARRVFAQAYERKNYGIIRGLLSRFHGDREKTKQHIDTLLNDMEKPARRIENASDRKYREILEKGGV